MATTGQAVVDFGAFPGVTDISLPITGQAGILSGSFVEAWVTPVATVEHSADEHLVDPPRVAAGNIVAGTGFTIYALASDMFPDAPRTYGRWTVNWVWA